MRIFFKGFLKHRYEILYGHVVDKLAQTADTTQEPNIVSQEEIKKFFGDKVPVTISRQVFELSNEIRQIRRYYHFKKDKQVII